MDVSIIIINYKSSELIINCISSIKEFTKNLEYEIIIVDNHSEDHSESNIEAKHPDIIWIPVSYNAGFSRANNVGMAAAKGKYFLLLNPDTLLFENTIHKSVERLKQHPDVAVIGGLQVTANLEAMHYFRNRNEFLKFLIVLPNSLNQWLDKIFPNPVFEDENQAELTCGAFMLLSRETVALAGKMDEDFFMYAEDFEWAGRLRKVGKLCYYPDIRFVHLEKDSPFRRTNISPINRFGTQMQVSNLLWIRKEYGLAFYLFLIFHYVSLATFFYVWKIFVNISKLRNPFGELRSQKIVALKTLVYLKFFWKTVFKIKGFYKIATEDNIDVRFK